MPQNFPDLARIDSMPKSFFYFEEKKIYFEQDMSVAAALLCAGVTDFRQTQVLHKPRGPFCMMGPVLIVFWLLMEWLISKGVCGLQNKVVKVNAKHQLCYQRLIK